ncbi:Trm112 family protein [Pelagibacterium montanilacus]|uniref:Trm112 family protein n=1 Tax=Pelagibacterium montanilacus TaxID=2185280 RepID=UPI000F8C7DA7|nr:Trm112 family protein [Pelagibacterium montanilacus]
MRAGGRATGEVDPRTLEMLVCPITKTRLSLTEDRSELVSVVARYAFPIRNGVPLLVLDAARKVTEEEIATLR